jgi:hypothetical protein
MRSGAGVTHNAVMERYGWPLEFPAQESPEADKQ